MTIEANNRAKIEEAVYLCDIIAKIVPKEHFIIAGGAIRDLINEKEITDIDYFIDINQLPKASVLATINIFVHLLKQNIGNPKVIVTQRNKSLSKFKSIQVQMPLCRHDLIFVDTTPRAYVLYKFDINFCKVWYSPNTELIIRSTDYDKDVENKTLTVDTGNFKSDQDEYPIGRSILWHIPKILKKYPDFRPNIVFNDTTPDISLKAMWPGVNAWFKTQWEVEENSAPNVTNYHYGETK